jgi:hypothetical protein
MIGDPKLDEDTGCDPEGPRHRFKMKVLDEL